jgi:hypothetical protein
MYLLAHIRTCLWLRAGLTMSRDKRPMTRQGKTGSRS